MTLRWPFTPLTTYASGVPPIKSFDLNAAQKAINLISMASLWWGDGTDGDFIVSSADSVITSDAHYDTVSVEDGHFLHTLGWPILASTSVLVDGTSHLVCQGDPLQQGAALGIYNAVGGPYTVDQIGPHGSLGIATGTTNAPTYSGARHYGLGGNGGAANGVLTKILPPGRALYRYPWRAMTGPSSVGVTSVAGIRPGVAYDALRGGGCGTPGTGDGAGGLGGGPGVGGGLIVLIAPLIHLMAGAALDVSGGPGGNATTDGNGGTGGGGGAFLFICQEFIDDGATYTAAGGTGGIGTGGGTNGAPGAAGNAVPTVILLPKAS